MDWFLVSAINAGLSVVSLTILLVTVRKMARTIRSTTQLDQKLEKAAQGLDQGLDRAIAALAEEHQHLSAQSKRLEEKIKQAELVRTQIDRSLAHLLQTRKQIKKELVSPGKTLLVKAVPDKTANTMNANGVKTPIQANGKKLPVFVMRKVGKTARPNIH